MSKKIVLTSGIVTSVDPQDPAMGRILTAELHLAYLERRCREVREILQQMEQRAYKAKRHANEARKELEEIQQEFEKLRDAWFAFKKQKQKIGQLNKK